MRFLLLEKAAAQCFIVTACNESWWCVPLCWFTWIPLAWQSGCGSSLYLITGNIKEVCCHPFLDDSPFIIPSEIRRPWRRKENTRLTVNKDHVYWIQVITWRQRMDVGLLVESGLCLSFRWVVEAAPWRPGTLAFHSSSSGSRTAQSWRETWLRGDGGGADRWHGAESGAFNYISIWTLVELTDQWSDLTPDPAVPLSSVKCFNLFQLFLLVYSPQLDFFGSLSPFFQLQQVVGFSHKAVISWLYCFVFPISMIVDIVTHLAAKETDISFGNLLSCVYSLFCGPQEESIVASFKLILVGQ